MRSKARSRSTATRPRRHRARNDRSGQDSRIRSMQMGTRSPDKRPPLSRRAVCCRTVAASFQYCSSGRVWWTRKSTGCGSVWSASAPSGSRCCWTIGWPPMANPSTGGTGSRRCSGTDLGACRADDAHQEARVSSIGTRTFWPGRAVGIDAGTQVRLRSQQLCVRTRWRWHWELVGRDAVGLPSLPVPPAATSAGSTTLAGSACAESEQYERACPAITSNWTAEGRRFDPSSGHASTRSTHPSRILIGRSPWRPSIARDAGGRWSVAASPRPGNVRVKPSGCSGHPPVTTVARNCVPTSPCWGSRNPSTVARWGCGDRQVVLPAVELVVRVRRVGGGDPPWSEYQPSGLAIARVETLRHQVGTASQASERRTTSSAEAAGAASAANVASSRVPNDRAGSNCRGVVTSRARWGPTARVDPGLAPQVGRSRWDKRTIAHGRYSRRWRGAAGMGRARRKACPDGVAMSRRRGPFGLNPRPAGSGWVRTEACRRACGDAPGCAMAGLAGCEVVAG